MIYISHRGNTNGKNPSTENNPDIIMNVLKLYDVEIDVWYVKDRFFLGHDKPIYSVSDDFFFESSVVSSEHKFWCHAKNTDALIHLNTIGAHFFWHHVDDYTLTSKKYVWIYPGKSIIPGSIIVLPETATYSNEELLQAKGICSDKIEYYWKLILELKARILNNDI